MEDAEPLFVDTTVLVHANVAKAPCHEQALTALKTSHRAGHPLWISRQVLREFVATTTRPQTFTKPSPPDVVIERVRYLEERFHVADDTGAVTGHLVKLLRDFEFGGKQVHDANIVATMLAYDLGLLLTYNVDDFKRFGELIRIQEPGLQPTGDELQQPQ